MGNEDREIFLAEIPKTPELSNNISPMVNLTEPIQVKKITGENEVKSLEAIISSLETSIENLKRLVDG